jgi:MFS family permease
VSTAAAIPTPPDRLWNRSFFHLWQGQLVSQLGAQFNSVALLLWLKHHAGSATTMGLLLMGASLPAVFLEPLGGVLSDRADKKRILVACDLGCAIAVLLSAIVLGRYSESTGLAIATLFAMSLGTNCLQAFFRPAAAASLPLLVGREQWEAANSAYQSLFQIAQLLGSAAAGILYRVCGAPLLFALDALSYGFAGLNSALIRFPAKQGPAPEKKSFRADFRAGLAFFWTSRGLRDFFFMFAINNFMIVPLVVLLPFYVEDHLRVSADWYGYLLAVNGTGMLAGYAAAAGLPLSPPARGRAVIASFLLVALLLSALAVPSLGLAVVLVLLIGASEGFVNVHFVSLVQRATPEAMMGRVFGVVSLVTGALIPAGMGLSGVIADILGKRMALLYGSMGLLLFFVTLAFLRSRPLIAFVMEKGNRS